MRALLRRYLRHLEDERNLSPNTLRAYRRDLERFLDFLATDYLGRDAATIGARDVDALAVRSYLAGLARAEVGARSRARALSALRGLFRENYERRRRVRLLGVALSNLIEGKGQLELPFADDERPHVDGAIDAVRERFGYDSIHFGVGRKDSRWR